MKQREFISREALGPQFVRVRWLVFAAIILACHSGIAIKSAGAETVADPGTSSGGLVRGDLPSREEDPFSGVSFPTFYNTGLAACTNGDGKPVIFLFSTTSCSHCDWIGETYDFLASYYMADGLIEAHHYDVTTGDDLLTEAIETEIPPEHLQLKEYGSPKGLVPYFNFSCKYERIGNGYEKTDDMASEGAEMAIIIEKLIEVLTEPE